MAKRSLLSEQVSYITVIWTLQSMYMLMYLQVTFVTECFTIQVRVIWVLTVCTHSC